jgi:hypothetical protein
VKISRLLEFHDQATSSKSLAHNLGDGFLLKNNLIYRNIREAAFESGFKFSSETNNAYLALPLTQLDALLNNKILPYIDNVSVLRSLPPPIGWDEISDGLKRNHLFHESCHAVASTYLQTKQKDLFAMMFEESFANICELLAVVFAEDPVHRIFLAANSYTLLNDQRTHLKNAMKTFGNRQLLIFLMLAYMHANFLRDSMTEKDFERTSQIAFGKKTAGGEAKPLKALAKIAFTLDERFRTVTSQLHLKLNGIDPTKIDLREKDFLKIIESREEIKKAIVKVSELALAGR